MNVEVIQSNNTNSSGNTSNTIDLANWMNDPLIKSKKLKDLVLIGSHDSAAYKFLGAYMPGGFLPGKLSLKFVEFCRQKCSIVNKIVSDWTLTQSVDIYEQLLLGVRVFDFRVAFVDNTFLFAHSFSCEKVEPILQQIKKFVEHHTSEVVIIYIKSDWHNRETMTNETYKKLEELLIKFLGEYVRNHSSQSPLVSDCQKDNKRIIFSINGLGSINLFGKNWSDIHLKMPKKFYINNTPDVNDVRNDILKRIFLPCGYIKKTLKNWGPSSNEKLQEYFYDRGVNKYDVNIWWFDFIDNKHAQEFLKFNYEK